MAFVGGFFALIYVFFRLEKYQVSFTNFLVMFLLCVISGIVGSKILFAFTQIEWLFRHFSVKNLLVFIPQSGYVFYGGLFGVLLAIYLYTKKDKEYRKSVFQMIAPAIPLFHSFGRVGCFLAGCCYGKELSNPVTLMGVHFYNIPIQLIESGVELIIFIVLVILDRKNKEYDLLKIYLILYAIVRFLDEFLRGDIIRGIYFGLSTAQWISFAILCYYIYKACKEKLQVKNEERV